MADEIGDVEYNDPLEGLDLGLLSFDKDGNKETSKDLLSESTRTQFEVRDGGEEPQTEEINKEEEPATEESTVEFSNDRPSIGVKETDEEDTIIEEEEGDADLWKNFAELGIIDLNEEDPEEKDLQWFADKAKEKLDTNVKSAIEDYKEDLPEEIKYLLDNYDQGVNVFDLLKADKKVLEYHNLKDEEIEESESLQKKLLADYYFYQGESEEDIRDLIEDIEVAGLLEKQSKRAVKKLSQIQQRERENVIQQQKQAEQERRKQYDSAMTTLKNDIFSKEEIIPGINLSDKQKKDIYNGITKFDRQGKNAVMRFRESNPEFDLVVAYLATVMGKDNKINWDMLTTAAETKATKNLKEKAKNADISSSSVKRKTLKGLDISIMKNAMRGL